MLKILALIEAQRGRGLRYDDARAALKAASHLLKAAPRDEMEYIQGLRERTFDLTALLKTEVLDELDARLDQTVSAGLSRASQTQRDQRRYRGPQPVAQEGE
jgi:hypothetical protein